MEDQTRRFPVLLNEFLVGWSYQEILTGCLSAAAVAARAVRLSRETFLDLAEIGYTHSEVRDETLGGPQ